LVMVGGEAGNRGRRRASAHRGHDRRRRPFRPRHGMFENRWKVLLVSSLVAGPVAAPFFVSATHVAWLRSAGTLYAVAALVAVLWDLIARLRAAEKLNGVIKAISHRARQAADALFISGGTSELEAVGDFDKPQKLEDRLVLVEYWKAVAQQRENEAREALACARSRWEKDLVEIRGELQDTNVGTVRLELLAALLVGLSIGFTFAADWWVA
jgi:hypothetical protein